MTQCCAILCTEEDVGEGNGMEWSPASGAWGLRRSSAGRERCARCAERGLARKWVGCAGADSFAESSLDTWFPDSLFSAHHHPPSRIDVHLVPLLLLGVAPPFRRRSSIEVFLITLATISSINGSFENTFSLDGRGSERSHPNRG